MDKLKAIPVDLNKFSNLVDNDLAKKAVYNKLVPQVNAIDTFRFVIKFQYKNAKSHKKEKNTDKKTFKC